MSKKIYYMVLRMNTDIEFDNLLGKRIERKLHGCAGYAPIYKTRKEAVENSDNNKYKIIELTASKRTQD